MPLRWMGTFVGGNDQLEKDENASLSGLSWLDAFVVNYEKKGVPKNAGVDSEEGFPMVRFCPCRCCTVSSRLDGSCSCCIGSYA